MLISIEYYQKQINKSVINILCMYFICGFRCMVRGTTHLSAALKEKFRDEVPKSLAASQ